MDEPHTTAPPQAGRDLILFLAALTCALRGWQLARTEVAARDSIGYIRIAWQLEHGEARRVIAAAPQHPGYPLAILALSHAVRPFLPGDLAYAMQLSAQLASALASVLLVVPLFLLGRELFDRRVSFWAVVLFQCLPATGRVMADGLSEPLFLLFAATALWSAARALRTGQRGAFAVCGLAGGLAYLTRPEGALVVAATGLVLIGCQLAPRWRRPWRRVGTCGLGLALPALAVALPFIAVTGRLTTKPTATEILRTVGREAPSGPGATFASAPLAVWWTGTDPGPAGRYGWGLWTLAEVVTKGFFYVFWLPALVGLYVYRDRFRTVPGTWVLLLVGVLLTVALYRVVVLMGYLSDRHTVLILLCGTIWAAAAIDALASRLARRPGLAGTRWAGAGTWSLLLPLALCTVPLAKTLDRLHVDRLGFRAAGYWLAANALPGDRVIDPYCWAHYYAGRDFQEGTPGPGPAHQPPVSYVVVEESGNRHSHLPEVARAWRLAEEEGHVVQRWKVPRGQVLVYAVPRALGPSADP
jgi:hypothetical protein